MVAECEGFGVCPDGSTCGETMLLLALSGNLLSSSHQFNLGASRPTISDDIHLPVLESLAMLRLQVRIRVEEAPRDEVHHDDSLERYVM
jgi:hypothetical protein